MSPTGKKKVTVKAADLDTRQFTPMSRVVRINLFFGPAYTGSQALSSGMFPEFLVH